MTQPQSLEEALLVLGKTEFRAKQRELIEFVLVGNSALGVLPTGAGKSLCYQIPALLLGKLTLVVSPLIALMRDQVEFLLRHGVSAARFDSTLSSEERDSLIQAIANQKLTVLFVAPESLLSPELNSALDQTQLGLFVVDEAHCLSEWGHSFRPDYLGLPDYAKSRPFHALLALTATATQRVREDLCQLFGMGIDHMVCLSPARPNIHRSVSYVSDNDKLAQLNNFLQEEGSRPAIVYTRTRKDTEALAAQLQDLGYAAKSYHAGLPAETRAHIQDSFFSGEADVLVATIAFGMGIDKQDVRSVVHYHPPTNPESYVQESGRAGRDGLPAKSLVLFNQGDFVVSRNRIVSGTPTEVEWKALLRRLFVTGNNVISTYGITTECDIPETIYDRVVFELKRAQVLEQVAVGYKFYKVKPLFPMSTIIAGREDDEVAQFQILDQRREGEVVDLAIALGMSWAETLDWLRDLECSGEWSLQFRQQATEFRTQRASDWEAWVEHFSLMMHERQDRELQRLDLVKQFLTEAPCLNKAIEDYFGFPADPCGHCSSCLHQPIGSIPELPPSSLSEDMRANLAKLVAAHHPSLRRAEQLTRYLLGLSGPAAMRARLWNNPLYGALSSWSWEDAYAECYALTGC